MACSIGEHTSVNHAWIFSALESATRGVVQALLDDGLVDEAKQVSSSFLSLLDTCSSHWLQIVNKWMARWISV